MYNLPCVNQQRDLLEMQIAFITLLVSTAPVDNDSEDDGLGRNVQNLHALLRSKFTSSWRSLPPKADQIRKQDSVRTLLASKCTVPLVKSTHRERLLCSREATNLV